MHIYDVFARMRDANSHRAACVIAKINILSPRIRESRLTSTATPPLRRPEIALPFLSSCSSSRINLSTDDRFAAILLLSEDLTSFERTAAVIAVRKIY